MEEKRVFDQQFFCYHVHCSLQLLYQNTHVETSMSRLLLLAIPSLSSSHYNLMPSSLRDFKKNLKFMQVLCCNTDPDEIYDLADFCLNLSSDIYISCVTLRRFWASLDIFSSNPMWWLNEIIESIISWVPIILLVLGKVRGTKKSLLGVQL